MASASWGDFFNSNNEEDLSAYNYNTFIAENGRPPNGADDFRTWQANAYLRDHGLTPQQWINQRWPGVTNATVDSSGNVNYTNYGDGLGEFFGVPALFGGMMLGANAISGLVNGAGAASAGTGAFDMGGNPSMLGSDAGTMGVGPSAATYNPSSGLFSTGQNAGFQFDPNTGTWGYNAGASPNLTTNLPGYTAPTDPASNFLPGGSYSSFGPNTYTPGSGMLTNQMVDLGGTGGVTGVNASLSGIPGLGNLAGNILSSAAGNAQSNNTDSSGGIGGLIGSTAHGLMALAYANGQNPIDTSMLSGVINQLQGNQNAVIKAATDPIQQNIAAGYGNLTQSLANRGVLGSSFGNTDLANFLAVNNNTLGNAGANAAQQSLGLQGNLAGQLSGLNAQSQLLKNNMYGRAFDLLGRGMSGQSSALGNLGNSVMSGIGNFVNPLLTGLGNSIGGLFTGSA